MAAFIHVALSSLSWNKIFSSGLKTVIAKLERLYKSTSSVYKIVNGKSRNWISHEWAKMIETKLLSLITSIFLQFEILTRFACVNSATTVYVPKELWKYNYTYFVENPVLISSFQSLLVIERNTSTSNADLIEGRKEGGEDGGSGRKKNTLQSNKSPSSAMTETNPEKQKKLLTKNTTKYGGMLRRRKTTTPTTTTVKPDGTGDGPWINDLTWDDATWILTASFIIFTMQTGFGMLESGCVSVRNESNIMMKNVVDVVFGGLTYWLFGFSISFGTDKGSTPYFGVGEYAVDTENDLMGPVFSTFMFQLSFATTATTIVSGTMAERCNFKAYCIFSLMNTVVYCVPARWIWGPSGFLGELHAIDIAGSGAVHLLGGVSGFIAAWMLEPRLGRYENGKGALPLGNPTSCLVGLYILWWGWLAFNSGSTFGVSGDKWKFAARAAVTTLIASLGGGIVGSVWTLMKPGRIFEVMDIVNPVLGALVGVTAGCALYKTTDAFIVGAIGGTIVIFTSPFSDSLMVDDPVGATAVHGFGGLWGLLAVAIFAEDDKGLGFTKGHAGFLRGGDFYLLKIQLLTALCIITWSMVVTFLLLWVINRFVPIRMEAHEELLGADFVEHLVRRRFAGISRALSVVGSSESIQMIKEKATVVGGGNPQHTDIMVNIKTGGGARLWKTLRAKTQVASAFMRVLKNSSGQRKIHESSHENMPRRSGSLISRNVVREYLGEPYVISDKVDAVKVFQNRMHNENEDPNGYQYGYFFIPTFP